VALGKHAISAAGALLILSLTAGPEWLVAQVTRDVCDRDLEELARGPHGYRHRDVRCEGIFAQQVGGTPLFVVSFTEYFEYGELAPGDSLLVDWPAPWGREVRLRAEGVSPRLHYRMDTVRPSGSQSFTWPADVLAAQDIERGDIGVLGWVSYSVGGRDREVLLPLRIRPKDASGDCRSYTLTVWNGPRLREIIVTVAPVEDDGRTGPPVWDSRPLGWRYYPAESPVAIPLPDLETPGVYYVNIAAERRDGGTIPVEAWIYHPGGTESGCDP
jgi:hypothetical protein